MTVTTQRLFRSFLALAVLLTAVPVFAQADPQLASRSAILLDATTGRILFTKNPDLPLQPASITKVLSLFIADEAIRDGKVHPQDTVRVSRKAGQTGGSRMFIQAGSEISLAELLTGMAVVSANDASVAVAEHIGGSVETFVARMNAKARELGMKHSVFVNPNGLPAKGQQTTARDMMILAREYLRSFPESLQIHSQQEFTYREITQHNRNALLKSYPNADGLKTGWVHAAGYHIIATAKRDNTRLIAVVMGAKNPKLRTRDAEALLDLGFEMVRKYQAKAGPEAGQQSQARL